MFKQKPFFASMFVLFFLLALHAGGSYYSLYWKFSWFDVLVHLMSGLWVGLVILWLISVLGQINSLKEYRVRSFLIALVAALLFGVIWELIENFSQITYSSVSGYGLDTAGDILSDGVGGILASLYFIRRKRCNDNPCDILHPFYNQTGIIKN